MSGWLFDVPATEVHAQEAPAKGPLRVAPPPERTSAALLEVPPSGETTPGATRAHSGRIVEEIVGKGMGLTLTPPDAKYDVCFDASRKGLRFEIKSVRRSGKSPLYDWRLKKDGDAGVPLLYLFAEHNARGHTTLEGLALGLVQTLERVFALTHSEVAALAAAEPLRNIRTWRFESNRHTYVGYNRAGYCEGYRNLGMKTVREQSTHTGPLFSGKHYGQLFAFRLFASWEAKALLTPVIDF
jgi:hypothetical protein